MKTIFIIIALICVERYPHNMITPKLIKAARVLLDWKQSDLARAAAVSETALANIERGATDPRTSTMNAIQQALEAAGVVFIPAGPYQGEAGPGVRLKGGTE